MAIYDIRLLYSLCFWISEEHNPKKGKYFKTELANYPFLKIRIWTDFSSIDLKMIFLYHHCIPFSRLIEIVNGIDKIRHFILWCPKNRIQRPKLCPLCMARYVFVLIKLMILRFSYHAVAAFCYSIAMK